MKSQWRRRKRLRSRQCLLLVLLGVVWAMSSLFHVRPNLQLPEDIIPLFQNPVLATSLTSSVDNDTKFILYYTTYWNEHDFQFGTGRQPFLDYNCPVHNCWAQSLGVTTQKVHAKGAAAQLDPNNNKDDDDDDDDTDLLLHVASEQKNLSQFDAVLFSVQAHDHFNLDDDGGRSRTKIEAWRRPNQRFVFFMMESQAYPIHNLQGMNGFFNWTMSFRWDSDIPRPYGWFEEKKKSKDDPDSLPFFYPYRPDHWIPYDEKQFRDSLPARPKSFHDLARRPGKVAWIVSHCDTDSGREDYVYQLRKYIAVDEFGGRCQRRDSPTCDQPYAISSSSLDNCTRHVRDNYKFYLALENQFCNDYVTEKFFERMEHSVVITLGQANYSDIAPPHSSISVFDFETAQGLATYLHKLDQDDESYLSYFWWKDFYRVRYPRSKEGHGNPNNNNYGQAMCRLCEKLHDRLEPTKVYENMQEWWRGSADCGRLLHGLRGRMVRDPGLPGMHVGTRESTSSALRAFARNYPISQGKQTTTILRQNLSKELRVESAS